MPPKCSVLQAKDEKQIGCICANLCSICGSGACVVGKVARALVQPPFARVAKISHDQLTNRKRRETGERFNQLEHPVALDWTRVAAGPTPIPF